MKEMLVTSMSHTSLTCQHENFSLLLLPQQETQKCPNADKPITGQDAVQKPLLGYRWTSRIRATPTAWTGQTEQGWQAPTHTRLERAPARFLNSGLPPGSLLSSTHSNHSSSSYLGHWGCWLEFINNTNTCGTGCAWHSRAHVPEHTDPWCNNSSLAGNASAPAGHGAAHHQPEQPQEKHQLPGAILSHLRAQAVTTKTVSSTF